MVCSVPSHDTNLDELFGRCEGAYSDLTLNGYRSDLEQFASWCRERELGFLPASPDAVASFVDDQAADRSIATLKRRVAAIQFAHRIADLPSPVSHSTVRLALRRAARANARRQKQVLGLTVELLERMVEACPRSLAGMRDAALLSVGYDSLCRSAELSAMHVEHLGGDYSTVHVPRSKSDPFGDGRVAYLSPMTKELLGSWIEAAGLIEGPLFRGMHTGKVSSAALDTSSIRKIVKRAAQRADVGCEATLGLSGHSMRVGAAQDMMGAGIDALAIMQAGGWRTYAVLARYVENAAGSQIHARRWQHLSGRSAAADLRAIQTASLKPNPGNARKHSKRQIRKIADSFRAFGVISPIIVTPDNHILAGHGRLEAAKLLGLSKLDVLIVEGLSPTELRAYALADNKLGDLSTFDTRLLLEELEAITLEEPAFTVECIGFDTGELDGLLGATRTADLNDLDNEEDAEPKADPVRP